MQAWGNKVAWESVPFFRVFSRLPHRLGAIIGLTNLIQRGGLNLDGLSKQTQQWFLLLRWLKLTHTPLAGALLSVEQPVSKYKVDLADYKLERCSYWDMAPLSLSLSLPLCRVPSLFGWRDKGKGGWLGVDGKRDCFFLVREYFLTVLS